VVAAWQSGAISQDTMLELFRRGEVLPEGRTNEEAARLVNVGKPELAPGLNSQVAGQGGQTGAAAASAT
jgi:hypothetical protein